MIALCTTLPYVRASDYEVSNNISISASTGGNSSGAKSGKASVDVSLEQVVNGINQESIHISTTSDSGSPIKLEVKSETFGTSSKNEVIINRDIKQVSTSYLVTSSFPSLKGGRGLNKTSSSFLATASSTPAVSKQHSKFFSSFGSFLKNVVINLRNNVFRKL
jgi:hypothetical protein